jgi:hypothetical protein
MPQRILALNILYTGDVDGLGIEAPSVSLFRFSDLQVPDSLLVSLDIFSPVASVVHQPPIPQSVTHANIFTSCSCYRFLYPSYFFPSFAFLSYGYVGTKA